MDSLRRKPEPPELPVRPINAPTPAYTESTEDPVVFPLKDEVLVPSAPKPVRHQKPPKSKRRFLLPLGIVLALIIVLAGVFLIWKGLATVQKIQVAGNTVSAPTLSQKLKTLQAAILPGDLAPLRGEERGRINILLLGKAGEGLPGENLTDTIMLASINTRTKQVALVSLPRDLYVIDTKNSIAGKINSFYQQGLGRGTDLEPMKNAISTITGEPIDYFFVMDFAGFESVVDALGGITVEVTKDFYDPRYPGKNYSYETFELSKGWQKLDGPTALKYVRERHDDPEGDFGRAKRQQQVLQAIKNKAASPGTYLNFFRINKLFESVANNVETDLTLPEMQSFYELSKTLDTQNITNQVIDAWRPESLLRVDHKTLGGVRAFTLVTRTGNWEETRDLTQNIFSLDALSARKTMITNEEATVLILDSGKTIQSAEKLAQYIQRELGMEARVVYAPSLKQESAGAMLISRSDLTKPYSFDELLKRLPLQKSNDLPTIPNDAPETDFVLTMNQDLADSFENADQFFNENLATDEETRFTE